MLMIPKIFSATSPHDAKYWNNEQHLHKMLAYLISLPFLVSPWFSISKVHPLIGKSPSALVQVAKKMPAISVHTSPRSTTSVVHGRDGQLLIHTKKQRTIPKRNMISKLGIFQIVLKMIALSNNYSTSRINENFRKVFQYWRVQSWN